MIQVYRRPGRWILPGDSVLLVFVHIKKMGDKNTNIVSLLVDALILWFYDERFRPSFVSELMKVSISIMESM